MWISSIFVSSSIICDNKNLHISWFNKNFHILRPFFRNYTLIWIELISTIFNIQYLIIFNSDDLQNYHKRNFASSPSLRPRLTPARHSKVQLRQTIKSQQDPQHHRWGDQSRDLKSQRFGIIWEGVQKRWMDHQPGKHPGWTFQNCRSIPSEIALKHQDPHPVRWRGKPDREKARGGKRRFPRRNEWNHHLCY